MVIIKYLFNPAELSGALFDGVIIIVMAWALGKILNMLVRDYLNRASAAGVDSTSIRFIGQLTKVGVYVLAVLVYAYLIPSLHSLGSAWLASVGIISLIVGLAMQNTLSNLVAGIALLLYRPFRVGDKLEVATPAGPEIGTVESIDLGYTRLCTWDGRRIVFPNSALVTFQTSVNLSKNSSHMRTEVAITLSQGGDIAHARETLLEIANTIPKITKVNGCFVTGISGAGTILTLSFMSLDPYDVAQIRSDLLERAKIRFDHDQIKLA